MSSEARRSCRPGRWGRDPRVCLGLLALSLLLQGGAFRTSAAAPSIRAGGSLGFGLTNSRQQGLHKWDLGASQRPVDLLRLKLEASPAEGLTGFLRMDAVSAGLQDPPTLELGEASLLYRHGWKERRFVDLRLFARQPQNVWLDLTLGSPFSIRDLGDDALGLRADLRVQRLFGTILLVDPASQDDGAVPRDDPFSVLRLGVDLERGVRLGGTWMRETAQAVDEADPETPTLSWGAVDLTWDWRAILFMVELAGSGPAASTDTGSVPATPQGQATGLLQELPDTAALRAEIRAASLGSARWGWIGFAPALSVVGREHVQRQQPPPHPWGSPRRGTQTWQLEAWYVAAAWPLWLRQTLSRHDAVVDADRSIDRWQTEIESRLTQRLRGRLRWTSRQVDDRGVDTPHRDLLVDAWFEESARRLRAQFGWIDIDRPSERQALVLEFSTPVLGRWNAVARSAMTREATRVRPGLFAELQYWHLPQFEFAVSYGSDVFGAAADPVLQADQLVAGQTRNVVHVHFRGWF